MQHSYRPPTRPSGPENRYFTSAAIDKYLCFVSRVPGEEDEEEEPQSMNDEERRQLFHSREQLSM